jgi:TPR repeat protein
LKSLAVVLSMALAACAETPSAAHATSDARHAQPSPERVAPPRRGELATACARDPNGADACQRACDAGVALGCTYLSVQRWQSGYRVCKDGSVLECMAACDGGNTMSCFMVGMMGVTGERVSAAKAKAPLERACARGLVSACKWLASRVYSGENDAAVARERACTLWLAAVPGEEDAYSSYENGSDACKTLAQEDPRHAAALLEPACERDNIVACLDVIGPIHRRHAESSQESYVSALERVCHASQLARGTRRGGPDGDPGACGMLKDLGAPP